MARVPAGNAMDPRESLEESQSGPKKKTGPRSQRWVFFSYGIYLVYREWYLYNEGYLVFLGILYHSILIETMVYIVKHMEWMKIEPTMAFLRVAHPGILPSAFHEFSPRIDESPFWKPVAMAWCYLCQSNTYSHKATTLAYWNCWKLASNNKSEPKQWSFINWSPIHFWQFTGDVLCPWVYHITLQKTNLFSRCLYSLCSHRWQRK